MEVQASTSVIDVPSAGVQVIFATQGARDFGPSIGWFDFIAL